MDAELDYSSEKIKIKKEKTSYNEDDCSMDACDQIDIKEGLIKVEYNLTDEWKSRDHVGPGHFKFVTPEDVKEEDTDVSSTMECISDPISIKEGCSICDNSKRTFTIPEYCENHSRRFKNKVYDQPSTSSGSVSVVKHMLAHTCKMHMSTCTDVRSHTCTLCGKSFAQKSSLTLHMRTHTGEKPYQCTQCDKSFTQSIALTRHVRSHTGEKPYRCPHCGKSFARSDILTKHIRIHFDEKSNQ